jgi:hypothetical protein
MLQKYDKQSNNLVCFIMKKIKLYNVTSTNTTVRKEMIYNKVKIFRSIYLYSNRFLRNNKTPIESMCEIINRFLRATLIKSFEFSNDIKYSIVEYDYTEQQIKYMTMAINNIRKFKQLYYNRKTQIATILGAKLLSTDLCRKITIYLY